MTLEQKIDLNKKIAGFRYSIIAELANPNLDRQELKKMIHQKAHRNYIIPNSSKTKLSVKTIKRWLNNFKNQELDGLVPKTRNDLGKAKALTLQEQDIFLNHLEKHPYLTAQAAFIQCQNNGSIKNSISSSALSRLVTAHGLDKKNRIKGTGEQEDSFKFNFRYPLECVQADFMHWIKFPDSKGKMKTAKMICFLDDATRRVLYARFTFEETAVEFERGLKTILSHHGKILKAYVDNGASFISSETKRILDILGIPIIHSKPYRPQGRGKQERWFRTCRDQFLRPLEASGTILTLEQLNVALKNWLECEYHRNPHSGLNKQTPLEAWIKQAKYITPMPQTLDLDEVFLHHLARKIYSDSTFVFQNQYYEVPSTLIGKKVIVKHDVHAPRPLTVFLNGQFVCEARLVDGYANTKVKRNSSKQNETTAPVNIHQKSKPAVVRHSLTASDIEL